MIFVIALAIIGVASSAYLLHQYFTGTLGAHEPPLTIVEPEPRDATPRAA